MSISSFTNPVFSLLLNSVDEPTMFLPSAIIFKYWSISMAKYRKYVIYWAVWLIIFAAAGYWIFSTIRAPSPTPQQVSELETKSESLPGKLVLMPYGRTKILAFKSATKSFNMSSHYWTEEFNNDFDPTRLKDDYTARVLPDGTPVSVRTAAGSLVFIAPSSDQDLARKLLPLVPLLIGFAVVPFILYVRKTNK